MRIGIVGGGVLGLTLALRLARAGHRVLVYEAGVQPGGLATWFDYGPFVWDKYYHVITLRDRHLISLIEELGLDSDLVWRPTRMGFLWQNRLLSMSNHREFLTFAPLSLWQKFRLGLGVVYTAGIRNSARYEHVAAADWLPQIFGRHVSNVMWTPLLESKFGVLASSIAFPGPGGACTAVTERSSPASSSGSASTEARCA